jgi:excisionase family DNA binding protein
MSAVIDRPHPELAATNQHAGAARRTLTMEEGCRELGIPKSTGYMLANDGRFPCRVIRVGSRFYIPKEAIEDLLSGRAA